MNEVLPLFISLGYMLNVFLRKGEKGQVSHRHFQARNSSKYGNIASDPQGQGYQSMHSRDATTASETCQRSVQRSPQITHRRRAWLVFFGEFRTSGER